MLAHFPKPSKPEFSMRCPTERSLHSTQIESLALRKPPLLHSEPASPAAVKHSDEDIIRVFEGLAAAHQALTQASGGDSATDGDVSEEEEAGRELREAAEMAMVGGSSVFAFPASAARFLYLQFQP